MWPKGSKGEIRKKEGDATRGKREKGRSSRGEETEQRNEAKGRQPWMLLRARIDLLCSRLFRRAVSIADHVAPPRLVSVTRKARTDFYYVQDESNFSHMW